MNDFKTTKKDDNFGWFVLGMIFLLVLIVILYLLWAYGWKLHQLEYYLK